MIKKLDIWIFDSKFAQVYFLAFEHNYAYLYKSESDFKEKCTQFLLPFPGTVLHAFSHGVVHFVPSVILRNHFLTGGNFSNSQSEASIYVIFMANTLNKMDHTMLKSMQKRAGKGCHKLRIFLFKANGAFGKMCTLKRRGTVV